MRMDMLLGSYSEFTNNNMAVNTFNIVPVIQTIMFFLIFYLIGKWALAQVW